VKQPKRERRKKPPNKFLYHVTTVYNKSTPSRKAIKEETKQTWRQNKAQIVPEDITSTGSSIPKTLHSSN
jgi:hypothetical protein